MKKLVFLVIFLLSGIAHSQIVERVFVDGSISVPTGDDPEGITIFNTTTKVGAVSDDNGDFMMRVGLGDELRFSALQYEDFTLVIDRNVIDAKKLNVFITQATTELPEVVVSPFDLSGNVEVDVKRIPVEETDLPEITEADAYDAGLILPSDTISSPRNTAMRDRFMEYGINFANVFQNVFSERAIGDQEFELIDEEVREIYDDEFYREHLDIAERNITDFILFAEENGLTEEMLEEGNELELIEFLVKQSRAYKARISE